MVYFWGQRPRTKIANYKQMKKFLLNSLKCEEEENNQIHLWICEDFRVILAIFQGLWPKNPPGRQKHYRSGRLSEKINRILWNFPLTWKIPMTFPFFLNFPPKNKDLKSESSYLMVFAHQIFLCKLTLSNRIGILFIFFQICPLRTNSSPTAFISCKILLFCQALYKTLIIKVAIFFFFWKSFIDNQHFQMVHLLYTSMCSSEVSPRLTMSKWSV